MKKEKIKKESSFKKKINELKKTSRGKAILRLIKWCIFFIILFIFLAIASIINPPQNNIKPNVNNETKEPNLEEHPEEKDNWNDETLTIETITKYQSFLSNVYDYNYEITINKEKYVFSGTKTPKEDTGYKESNTGIIKYYIDSTGTYMETTTNKELISNLYEGLEENYLNPIYILNIVKELKITKDLEYDGTEVIYKASDSKNIYRITTLDKNITGISITALDFSYLYTLSFKNVK